MDSNTANTKATQVVASVAAIVFSPVINQQLQRLARTSNDLRDYIIGCLVFAVTSAVHPEFLPVEKRLATFNVPSPATTTAGCGGGSEAADGAGRNSCWADAGFFLAPSTTTPEANARSAICFHCGTRCCFPTTGEDLVDPIQLHKRCSKGCELARLLNFVISGNNGGGQKALSSSEEVSASAAKLRRAIAKLMSDLPSSRLLEHVESYGFERRLVAFCACREFMRTRDGRGPTRPGDLIQAMHSSEALLNGLPLQLDIEAALKEIGAPAAATTTAVPATTAMAAQAVRTMVAEPPKLKPQEESQPKTTNVAAAAAAEASKASPAPRNDAADSEQCTGCRKNTRDQVTLPCAHFLLCRQCACERRSCPQCDKPILATIRAFVA